MKKFLILAVGLILVAAIGTTNAQTKAYKMGYKAKTALTSSTTISVTPEAGMSLTLYTLAADTNVTFSAVTTYAVPADMLVFEIKGNTRSRIITWGTNLDSTNDTIATGKTWTYSFIWNGTAFKKLCKSITD